MEAFATLHKISARSSTPGLPPAYSAAHVLKAIDIIGSPPGIGRQRLATELGLGEGTTRTLINRLRDEGLIEVSRGGMGLTASGEKLLNTIKRLIRTTKLEETDITVGVFNYAVLVKSAAAKVRNGVEQRDAALLAGARGATTLVFEENRFHMPGMEIELPSATSRLLRDKLSPDDGDVVIIGTANSLLAAELGAKAAALEILMKY